MKKIILSIVVIAALIAGGYYLYITRPASAPSQDIQAASDTLNATATSTLYRISQSQSSAQFTINEMLYGKPKLVIGTTTQIAGDIEVSPAKMTIGTIKLNAKTLTTDNTSRNGAINHLILKTDSPANEFVVF